MWTDEEHNRSNKGGPTEQNIVNYDVPMKPEPFYNSEYDFVHKNLQIGCYQIRKTLFHLSIPQPSLKIPETLPFIA